MKLMKYLRKVLVVSLVGTMIMTMVGCSNDQNTTNNKNTETEKVAFEIPEAGSEGGYEINNDALYCTVLVDNDYKYAKFDSKTGEHSVEYYASPTEMVIIDKSENGEKYYYQEFEDIDQIYTNPLKAVYDDLKGLDFEQVENKEDEEGLKVFQALKVAQVIDQKQIDYTEYKLTMKWIDGKDYLFSYYEYIDGSTLISAEAPDEINDMLTPDTKWIVDIEKQLVKNTETNEEVDFVVETISTGKAISPDGNETEIIEAKSYVYVWVNEETGLIEKMQYSETEGTIGLAVSIINDVEIIEPVISEDMVEMSEDELYLSMMIVGMLESLI